MRLKILFFIIISLLLTANLFSQEMSDEEVRLENKAFKLFLDNKFAEAKPLFSQLLSLYPSNADYNYGYGACLVETNQDIDKAIKYLNYAKQKSDNPVVYYYLGLASHNTYDFKNAIKNYNIFERNATQKEIEHYKVKQKEIECQNGLDLIKFISDLVVIDNKKINKEDFYYSYNLDDFGGKLILEPIEFKSKVDKKKLPKNIMFLPNNLKTVFYTSYGNSRKNSKDIYQRFLNDDNSWSEPIKLGPEINTKFDEDYAVIHPNGKELFFSSKGHNSMGGYDIFRSQYDSLTQKWSQAENIDFPINSPFDDILYISDKNEDYAYFASNRETFDNNISVYKILVDKNPIPRPINNIDDIKTKSKLIISSDDEIKQAESKHPLLLASNKSNENKNKLPADNFVKPKSSHSYKFDKITETENLTSEDIKAKMKTDVLKVQQSSDDTRKDAYITYLLADSLKNLANKQSQELNNLKSNSSANNDEINVLEEKLNDTQTKLVATYNLSKSLDKTSQIKTQEVEQAMQLADRLEFSDEGKQKLIDDINANRDKLNKNQNKYTSVETELQNRKDKIAENQNKIEELKNNETKIDNDLKNIVAERTIIQNEIKNESDSNKKQELKNNLNKLIQEQDDKLLIRDKIIKDKQLLVEDNKTNNIEIDILKNVSKILKSNNEDLAIVEEKYNNIDKQNLDKKAFDSELKLDQEKSTNISKLIAENIKEKNSQLQEITKPTTNNNIAENNTNNVVENKTDTILENKNNDVSISENLNNTNENIDTIKPNNTEVLANNNVENSNDIVNVNNNIKNNTTKTENITSNNNSTVENNSNNNYKLKEEIKILENKSTQNKLISDSLSDTARQLQDKFETITDENEKANLQQQIGDLYELSEIKRSQSINQQKQADEKQKTLANSTIKTENTTTEISENPLFSFNNDENSDNSDLTNYKKKYLENIYYENKLNQNNNKIATLNDNITKIDDFNTKELVKKQITQIENENKELKNKISKNNIEIKKTENKLGEATDSINPQNIIYFATNYKLKSTNKLDNNDKSKVLDFKQKQSEINSEQNELNNLDKNILSLKKSLAESKNAGDNKSIKNTSKKIEELENQKSIKQNDYYTNVANLNKGEYEFYSNLIYSNKENGTNKQVDIANQVENESVLFNKQADLIRKDINLIQNDSIKQAELNKANLLERIAIQKQKYALDTYLNNKNAVLADNNDNKSDNNVILLPDEKENLNKSTELNHKAQILETQANKELAEVAAKEKQAAEVYSKSQKKKILKNTQKTKIANQQKLFEAYNISKKADSLKYNVYKNQIKEISSSSKNKQNVLISNQYNKEAEFYFKKAQETRLQADNYSNVEDKLNILKKAKSLEQKALDNQSLAVDVLLNQEPVTFVVSNSLVKVNNLQANNSTINVDDIHKYKTQKIIEGLKLSNKELKNLDAAKTQENSANKMIADADSLQNIITSLEEKIKSSDNNSQNKKDKKEIKKLKEEMFKLKFSAAEAYESINNIRYFAYIDNIKKVRIRDNSQNAKQGKQLENNCKRNFNKAKNLRDKSFFIDDPVKAYDLLVQASKLEKTGIEDIEKAIGVYLNLPNEEETANILAENKTTNDDNNLIENKNADITPINTDSLMALNNTTKEDTIENKSANNNLITKNSNDTLNTHNNIKNNTIKTENVTSNNNVTVENNTNNNDRLKEEIKILENKSTQNKQISDSLIGEARQLQDKFEVISDENEKANLQQQIGDLYELSEIKRNESINQQKQADEKQKLLTNNNINNNTDNNIIAENKNTNNNTKNNTNNNTIKTNNTTNENKNTLETKNYSNTINTGPKYEMQYSISSVSPYSDENPIPMNVKLPNGIVFKIQIGAFKSKISQDAFKGLNPITGEKLNNSKFTKYLVGLFYSFEGTRIALKEVKALGYKDAFIVAYKDGKRVPVYQAKSILQQQPDYNILAQTEVDKIKNRTGARNNVTPNKTIQNNNNINKTETNVINSTDIKTIQDLFYTVQIGVYKNKVSSKEFYNISPIYKDQTEYGFIRYTTGVFQDKNTANIEKNRIVKLGIKDAFVTAYYKGKKLTNKELNDLLNKNVNFAKGQDVKLPETSVTKQPEINKETANIIFKVQIGAYKKNIPIETVTAMLSVARKKELNSYKDGEKTVYTVGEYKTYESAVKMKDIIKNEGIIDAFVVAYNNGVKINLEQAISVLNK